MKSASELTMWTYAPEWAQYAAMDANGDWYWFEEKPEFDNVEWRPSSQIFEEFNSKALAYTYGVFDVDYPDNWMYSLLTRERLVEAETPKRDDLVTKQDMLELIEAVMDLHYKDKTDDLFTVFYRLKGEINGADED